jgi:hypothetical protein
LLPPLCRVDLLSLHLLELEAERFVCTKVLHGRAVEELFAMAEFALSASAIERFALAKTSGRVDLPM